MLDQTYRGRRVLLTGCTGFKGIWMSAWLRRMGADLRGVSLPPTAAMQAGWPGVDTKFDWHEQDVCELEPLQQIFDDFEPEIVFHMAAQPLVRLSYVDPVGTFAANVMGTVNVLECVRHCNSVKATVVISTDKCYENSEWHWGYRESDPLGGSDPYSASKACTEIVTGAYARSFGCHNKTTGREDLYIGSGRAGNVIGGGDWADDRLVPDIVRAVLNNQPVRIRNPHAIRPWQHVLEPLAGYLQLGARLLECDGAVTGGWNFGPHSHEAINVRQVADLVIDAYGQGEVIVESNARNPKEAGFLKLDSSRAMSILGWAPLLSNRQRIAWTVDWYRSWQSKPADVWAKTREQIDIYSSLMAEHANSLGCSSGDKQSSAKPQTYAA